MGSDESGKHKGDTNTNKKPPLTMELVPCSTTTWNSACKNFHGIHVSEVVVLKQT